MSATDDVRVLGRSRLSFARQGDLDEFVDKLDAFEKGVPADGAKMVIPVEKTVKLASPVELKGTYAKLTAAMFMWGGTWIAGRIVAQELPAPLMAAAFRFLLAGVALAGFALLTEGAVPRPSGSREWGVVTGLAATGIFLYALCFFYGLKYIPAGRGALVVALNPVDRAEALYQLALAHFEAGDAQAARREVLRALEDAPNFEKAQELLLRLQSNRPGGNSR